MEKEISTSYRRGFSQGLIFGFILILAGAFFLAFNLGYLPLELKSIVFSWQMLLIVFGIWSFIRKNITSGIALTLIGCFFMVPELIIVFPATFGHLGPNFTENFWPALLIIGGISLIAQKLWAKPCSRKYEKWNAMKSEVKTHLHTPDFSKNSIFGGGEYIVLDPEFKGGELNAIFGGIVLDLRKTQLMEGETKLEINAIFGGVSILVPNHWYIETHLDTVFGGFEDKRSIDAEIDRTKKLVITGACVFGGGELKN